MKSKLLKAVEQTARKYEDFAVREEKTSGYYGLFNSYLDRVIHFNDASSYRNYQKTVDKVTDDHDIASCLAIMVYVWGFINFGESFNK